MGALAIGVGTSVALSMIRDTYMPDLDPWHYLLTDIS